MNEHQIEFVNADTGEVRTELASRLPRDLAVARTGGRDVPVHRIVSRTAGGVREVWCFDEQGRAVKSLMQLRAP